ncbi:DUF5326 family protein [Streptomyces candidus]|uniref:Membrane protein implicated in regulation of membrane protease activity n=1 Tax=Streptomyces candidus TaxID=67283 RepID=A0A7X0LR99_9ACTN|nr:DUF5326 family protein [Streptomyces candidus]MBB6437264.1 membrane protein implicated in regulation of membrane protease activity [Streptomyces candidus]GHH38404.1 hypothetical protein GCM10018773_16400 [Streptomyces candidus]
MAAREIFAGLPGWVKWIAIPALVLLVFGGTILAAIGALVGLLFKLLLLVALVGGLIYVVRRFMASSSAGGSSRGDW